MPRSLWKGYISFGLVAIPVSIVAVEQKNELRFHLLDSKDKSCIRYQRVSTKSDDVTDFMSLLKK